MPSVQFEGRSIPVGDGETILDALENAGHPIPHSCRAGACHSCLVRATKGRPPEAAQVGLNPARKAQGYFLACVARPEEDLVVDRGDGEVQRARGRLSAIDRLAADVLRVRIEPESEFAYRPGQFLTMIRDDGLSRTYSIASRPGRDAHLELHVRVLPQGRMGLWLDQEARLGDPVTIQGPSGHCMYVPDDRHREILLAGTGTGLAPLFGIARDALDHDHEASITLFHGARAASGLYLDGSLRELQARSPRFRYVPCCLDAEGRDDVEVGRLEDILARHFPSVSGRRVYLCGNPATVQSLRKLVFLKGASIKEIFIDAFLTAPPIAT